PAIEVTVRAALPVVGLLGPPRGLEVAGHAAIETLE
ncbi:MAG: TadE family protein, partial [Actinomycetota bacterium]|nr:TadE family protein [Actinomycetota bacterium]